MLGTQESVNNLAAQIQKSSKVLFLGGVDVGKTTLIKSLQEKIGGEVVDADVGQSEIGPPAVISRGTYQEGPQAGYFVGDISPRGNFLQVLTGIQKMLAEAQRPCLIDTDGYIGDGAARAYKSELINLVQPDLLVLMQRAGELDYYKLYAKKGIKVIEFKVQHSGLKSREERIKAREAAFAAHFQAAKLRSFSLKDLSFERMLIGHGELLDADLLSKMLGCSVKGAWRLGQEAVFVVNGFALSLGTVKRALGVEYIHLINGSEIQNLLVGCLNGSRFAGLGVLKNIKDDKVEILTPAEQVTILQAGSLQVSEDGRHERIQSQVF